ncbi:MAG: DUF1592 domain-containing protein, partial [Nannocystaceae bacterium]
MIVRMVIVVLGFTLACSGTPPTSPNQGLASTPSPEAEDDEDDEDDDDSDDSDDSDDGSDALDCGDGTIRPGRAPMRRLTVIEYDNTIRDLLGDDSSPAQRLVDAEPKTDNVDARPMTPLLAEQYMAVAEDVAARAVTDLEALLACDPTVSGEDPCVEGFLAEFLPRAYRRPVEATALDSMIEVYRIVRAAAPYDVAVSALLEAVLQSPGYLYRVELAVDTGPAVVRLDNGQLASRLSYLIWSTMPDSTRLSAAGSGELDTDAGVEEQARRMLADPRARPTVQRFFANWAELHKLEDLVKDLTVFPDYHDGIPDLFRTETLAFIDEVLYEGDASWVTLLTAPWTMANEELAAYYGLEGAEDPAFTRIERDPRYHAGLLTHGGVLASRDRAYETSPIHRGMFVRAGLICGGPGSLPEPEISWSNILVR